MIGPKNALSLIIFLPLTIAFLGLALFEIAHLNPAFPLVILVITSYSTVNIAMLLEQHDDHAFRKTGEVQIEAGTLCAPAVADSRNTGTLEPVLLSRARIT